MRNSAKQPASFVKVAPGLALPTGHVEKAEWGDYLVEVEPTVEAGKLVARTVTVRQREGGPPVTGEAVRSIPIGSIVKWAAKKVATYDKEAGGATRISRPELYPETLARIHQGGPTDEALWWVAHLYRYALLIGDPPLKKIEELMQLPRSTAGRWIRQARQRVNPDTGETFLGPSEGTGKAGG